MVKTLTDLSQLTKAILKESPPSRVEPAPAAQPAPTVSDEDREAEEVLAYFSRTPQKASRSPRVAPRGVAVADRPVAPEAALEAKAAGRSQDSGSRYWARKMPREKEPVKTASFLIFQKEVWGRQFGPADSRC